MTDVLTKSQRSYNMSQIKGKSTEPELILRKILFKNGIRGYRVACKVTGKPDVTFPKYKLAIFVDGCFWHKCPCCFIVPKTRTAWWLKKINGNVARDKTINKQLEKSGWKVLRFWEHLLREDADFAYKTILAALKRRVANDNKNT
jgi:DNA mismatch endonuclease, patch repair protein